MDEETTIQADPPPPEPCPRCLQLRTKMDYVARMDGDENEAEERFGGNTAHRWYCLLTMNALGPDRDIVGPTVCTTERECYEKPGF